MTLRVPPRVLRPLAILLAGSALALASCDQPKQATPAAPEAPAGKVRPARTAEPISWDPAGKAFEGWVEGLVTLGASGITPITEQLYAYGAVSLMTTGSKGQELFTDLTRSYTAIEDAYIGIVGGNTSASGNRLAFNLSAGRQRFTLANALLIANTAANGDERAALQANARWASDLLALGQVSYNTTKLEVFYVDPDELPVINTNTRIGGINVETLPLPGLMLAASYLSSPQSS
jgi:hypothetical protein